MLKTCEECGLPVSDKAFACPHCGNPQKVSAKSPPGKNSRKRLKLPNGFGRITKIKGRQRKPYRAMVTIGKDSQGKPIGKLLKPCSYFDTYNEAYAALLEYNKNPYDLLNQKTVAEVYEDWSRRHFQTVTDATARNIRSSFNYCSLVHGMPFRDIRIKHIKLCMEEGFVIKNGKTLRPSPIMQKNIKQLWNQLFDYAIEYEIVDRNYAREYNAKHESTKTKNPHMTYTDQEIDILLANQHNLIAQIILFQCYTGLRPQEMTTIKTTNVHLSESYIIAGMKSEAGRDRIIPLHDKAKKLTEVFLESSTDRLITFKSNPYVYTTLRDHFQRFLKEYNLSPQHRLHDGRKHFITQAKRYGVDEYAIKRIVGHSIKKDLTESVYTERDLDWLLEEIRKIP